jgi:transcriptional regulator with PAS, ATPase and Fis domain
VRLLRVLQDGTFTPVGSTKEQAVDVRIIAATNKNLMTEVAEGRFREDLFYRVAIGVIHLPPLRERAGDLSLLSDALLANINNEGRQQLGHVDKKISASARNIISKHPWPGNIRELNATLLRASLWQPGEMLSETDIKESLIQAPARGDGVMGRDISQGIDINEIISSVCTHYIERALEQCSGSKSRAAELLGLASYQTLTNWMDKYGINS